MQEFWIFSHNLLMKLAVFWRKIGEIYGFISQAIDEIKKKKISRCFADFLLTVSRNQQSIDEIRDFINITICVRSKNFTFSSFRRTSHFFRSQLTNRVSAILQIINNSRNQLIHGKIIHAYLVSVYKDITQLNNSRATNLMCWTLNYSFTLYINVIKKINK